MSNREKVFQRLEAAVASLEAAADHRIANAGREAGLGASEDAGLRQELDAVRKERDSMAAKVEEQSNRNADLGARLDKAIAKLNKVLEKA